MYALPIEIFNHHISKYLSLQNTIRFMCTCHKWYENVIIYHWVEKSNIENHMQLDHFKCVRLPCYDVRWQHLSKIKIDTLDCNKTQFVFPDHMIDMEIAFVRGCIHFAWPRNLKHLCIGHYNDIFKYEWPTQLKTLAIYHYNQPFKYALPERLQTLILHAYNYELPSLPNTIRKLILRRYDKPLHLPQSLTCLDLSKYNHAFTNAWPSQLKKIYLDKYNHPLKQAWPNTLKRLVMYQFNYPLTQPWPSTLEHIQLFNYDQPFTLKWPEKLNYLEIREFNSQYKLPDNVECNSAEDDY